jgi:predicted nucleic acid-binding protein
MSVTARSWICVDANLVFRRVAEPRNAAVQELWANWHRARQPLAAPTLLHYEVANALHRARHHGLLSPGAVQLALTAALALPVERYQADAIHRQALDLAALFSLPAAYEAHYLALAMHLGAQFWTTDRRLAGRVQAALPWVHVVET